MRAFTKEENRRDFAGFLAGNILKDKGLPFIYPWPGRIGPEDPAKQLNAVFIGYGLKSAGVSTPASLFQKWSAQQTGSQPY